MESNETHPPGDILEKPCILYPFSGLRFCGRAGLIFAPAVESKSHLSSHLQAACSSVLPGIQVGEERFTMKGGLTHICTLSRETNVE